MSYFLSGLLSFLLLYKYWAIFIIVLTGGILIPWPTNTLLLATGAFASQGYFNLALAFTIAVIANVMGDSIGYFLTYKWGFRFIKERHVNRNRYASTITEYMQSHVGLTVFTTRFLGSLDPLTNFLAGLIKIPYKKFVLWSALGNGTDIAVCLLGGYFLGSVWQDFSGITNTMGWILLIVVIINIAISIFWKKKV
jgi:membrane-associated protein